MYTVTKYCAFYIGRKAYPVIRLSTLTIFRFLFVLLATLGCRDVVIGGSLPDSGDTSQAGATSTEADDTGSDASSSDSDMQYMDSGVSHMDTEDWDMESDDWDMESDDWDMESDNWEMGRS